MSEAADDPAERMLGELAQLDLALARRVQAAAMEAQEPEVVADLARAYQRVARSLRQTLALQARLKQDRARADREERAAPPPKPSGAAIRTRIRELTTAINRVIEREAEDAEAADWLEEMAREDIALASLKDDFVSLPLDEHVEELAEALGLPPESARRWREEPSEPELQSSA